MSFNFTDSPGLEMVFPAQRMPAPKNDFRLSENTVRISKGLGRQARIEKVRGNAVCIWGPSAEPAASGTVGVGPLFNCAITPPDGAGVPHRGRASEERGQCRALPRVAL